MYTKEFLDKMLNNYGFMKADSIGWGEAYGSSYYINRYNYKVSIDDIQSCVEVSGSLESFYNTMLYIYNELKVKIMKPVKL